MDLVRTEHSHDGKVFGRPSSSSGHATWAGFERGCCGLWAGLSEARPPCAQWEDMQPGAWRSV